MRGMEDLNRLKAKGIEKDPKAQCLRDIHDELYPMMMAKTGKVAFVVMGDFNMQWGAVNGGGPIRWTGLVRGLPGIGECGQG